MERIPQQPLGAQKPEKETRPTMNTAMAEIVAIEQEVLRTGSVDSERDAFTRIRTDLLAKRIEPEEAIRQARRLQGSRQDYH